MMKRIYNAATGEEQDIEFTSEELASLEGLQSESAMINARANRDMLLTASDWRVVADAPWDTTAWATYRQALRDLPADPNWPNVEFPDPPEAN